ncbi:DNA damage-inducible protein 1 [Kwoniella mangroviensis CBS 10435]|uniref:DNA damage-inducible protein 1 n=1 Tax=Kwoniella mangroviensis CBS 10435 TaxID=1331196 RepID=A0A1B9IMH2_9TREE|nr:DNA damage-inducible protein 1 [Kwoniella mangroviensis CBS 10435]
MKLTIIAPDTVYEHEVSSDMEIQDVQALIEAESGLPHTSLLLSTDSGVPLTDVKRTLSSYGLTGEESTVFLTSKPQPAASSSSSSTSQHASASGPSSGVSYLGGSDDDIERMRLQALGNPGLMNDLRNNDPETYQAIQGGTQSFKRVLLNAQQRQRAAAAEKQRQIELLNADPYDIEAQKKIEEAIRMEAVMENMQHAMEYSPESFGNVTMLYINVEVNGHPVKAFVDSGAQTTIISPECAEACGIMRLLDTRFAGMAEGVGTARILGRIHSAQIKLGGLHLPCAFSVLEGRAVDLLFGLDMLKRHQCCIDLSTNTLRINNTEVPFLPEHELPDKARRRGEAEMANELGDAASQGVKAGVASPTVPKREFPGNGQALGGGSTSSSGGQRLGGGSAASSASGSGGGSLIGLGALRDQAIQLLQASGGNVDVAASMLFG